jgi:hypothetical protein
MACITHLKHTAGSIIAMMPADAFSTGENSGRKEAAWAPSLDSAKLSIAEH